MKYLLILKSGKIMNFYVKSVAETYQIAYGGTLVTDEIYVEAYSELLVEV